MILSLGTLGMGGTEGWLGTRKISGASQEDAKTQLARLIVSAQVTCVSLDMQSAQLLNS